MNLDLHRDRYNTQEGVPEPSSPHVRYQEDHLSAKEPKQVARAIAAAYILSTSVEQIVIDLLAHNRVELISGST